MSLWGYCTYEEQIGKVTSVISASPVIRPVGALTSASVGWPGTATVRGMEREDGARMVRSNVAVDRVASGACEERVMLSGLEQQVR